MNPFESLIRELTSEINGQYPRPWMTDSKNPSSTQIFIIGYNPARAYATDQINYERYIDSLFNRNGEDCRSFYREVTSASPTRGNIEMFADKLKKHGITDILETNVVCYGAAKKKYLSRPEHTGGKEHGIRIFLKLLNEIQPKAVVVHGAGVAKEFSKALGLRPALPSPPNTPDKFVQYDLESGTTIFVIPSLALPGFQNWPTYPLRSFCNWADNYLDIVAMKVANACTT
jgi:hypothetical protein